MVVAAVDRRDEFGAEMDAALIAVKFDLDIAVKALRAVADLVAPFPFMLARIPVVARLDVDGRARAYPM
jgi:hypothetical protein